MLNMDIASLRSLVLFSEHQSLVKVADIQCRTHAAISAQLKKLESHYGTKLFQKIGRQLALTDVGARYADMSRCIVEMHDAMMSNAQEKDPVIKVRVGCPSDYTSTLLVQLVSLLTGTIANCQADLIVMPSTELKRMWKENNLDLFIYSTADETDPGYTLCSTQGRWVASKENKQPLIKPLKLVLYDDQCLFHKSVIKAFQQSGIDYQIISTTSDTQSLLTLVENSDAISAMTSLAINERIVEIEHDELPELPTLFIKIQISERLELIKSDHLLEAFRSASTR